MTKVSPLLLLLAALAFSSIEARLGNSRRQQKLRGVKQLPRSLLQGFGGSPDSSKFPLQKCQGDCDVDEDCEGELVCYQRGKGMAVPGCPGGEEENSRTDFCVDPTDLVEEALEDPTIETAGPSGENYSDLTMVPTLDATIDGTIDGSMTVTEDLLPPLETLGNDGAPADVYPLGLCQGECDTDEDCAGELICFQRDAGDSIPGCQNFGDYVDTNNDYCVRPPPADPTMSPTNTEVISMAPSVGESSESGVAIEQPELLTVGNDGDFSVYPLSACMGDCDTNEDCLPGLVCFQRDMDEDVPGCRGVGDYSVDYCIDPAATIQASSEAPIEITEAPTETPKDDKNDDKDKDDKDKDDTDIDVDTMLPTSVMSGDTVYPTDESSTIDPSLEMATLATDPTVLPSSEIVLAEESTEFPSDASTDAPEDDKKDDKDKDDVDELTEFPIDAPTDAPKDDKKDDKDKDDIDIDVDTMLPTSFMSGETVYPTDEPSDTIDPSSVGPSDTMDHSDTMSPTMGGSGSSF